MPAHAHMKDVASQCTQKTLPTDAHKRHRKPMQPPLLFHHLANDDAITKESLLLCTRLRP